MTQESIYKCQHAFDRVIIGDLVGTDRVLRDGYVAVRGESIAAIGQGAPPPAAETLDHRGRLILPGLVDGHMHTSSAIGWAGIEGATRSAAAGGVTTCVDMPYDVPQPVTDAEMLADKIGWVERTAHVDMALYGTILKTGGVAAIPELAAGGISAFKLSTYEYDAVRFPRIDHPTMVEAFARDRAHRPAGRRAQRGPGTGRAPDRAGARRRADRADHALPHPPAAGGDHGGSGDLRDRRCRPARMCTSRTPPLARGFDLAATFRGMGMQATGEACIQYLCMTEDDLVRLGGRGKCNPPFRTAAEVERMWAALADDKIAYVSTDHAPWPLARKTLPDIFACGAGLVGLQSFAPLMFTLLDERGLPPTLMATYCAERSAKLHGLWPRKGALRVGLGRRSAACWSAAISCSTKPRIVDRPELRWSPYHGRRMRARVAATMQRGRLIWDGTQVLAQPGDGRFVRRVTC